MKKTLIIVVCMTILFVITGCGKKSILYRYNIENINYNEYDLKAYRIEYRTIVDGDYVQVTVKLEFNSDGTCQYYSTQESDAGIATSSNNSNCTYETNNEKVSIKIDSIEHISEPSDYYRKNGFTSDTTYEYNIEFDGVFSENGRYLQIGKLQYKNNAYLVYLENGVTEFLLNPENDKKYKMDGTPLETSNVAYERINSIDISKYQIIDSE